MSADHGTSVALAIKSFAVAGGYPIVLDLSGKLIVVIGGGNVARRKVQGLIASGAERIRVVAPTFHPEISANGSVVERVAERYQAEHLCGAALVFAATDSPDVNDQVVRDARQIGALVCRADVVDELAGDFSTPAMIRDGELLLTVSSGGSPALSALIRDRLSSAIDPNWSKMAHAMQQLRPIIRNALPINQRKQAFHDLRSDEAFARLVDHGEAGLKQWLIGKYPQLALNPITEQGN